MGIIDQPARRARITRELTEPIEITEGSVEYWSDQIPQERALMIVDQPAPASEETQPERRAWWKLW